MKHVERMIALVALATAGLLGTPTAEAHGYHARDAAFAYCNLQGGLGLQCTVVEYGYGHGCRPDWVEAQVFSDDLMAYAACTHQW